MQKLNQNKNHRWLMSLCTGVFLPLHTWACINGARKWIIITLWFISCGGGGGELLLKGWWHSLYKRHIFVMGDRRRVWRFVDAFPPICGRFPSRCKIMSNFCLKLYWKRSSKRELYYLVFLLSLVMKLKKKRQPQKAHLCHSRLRHRIMRRNW